MENKRKKKQSRKPKQEKSSNTGRLWIKLLVAVILTVMGIFTPMIFKNSPQFVDRFYTKGVFVAVRTIFGAVSSLVPVSISELVIIGLFVALITLIITAIVKICTKSFKLRSLGAFFCSLLLTLSILLNLFNLMWGLNYKNSGFTKSMNLNLGEKTTDNLYGMCISLREEANALRKKVELDNNGVFTVKDTNYLFSKVAAAASCCKEVNPDTRRVYPAKPVIFSGVMSALGTSGIYMPFFVEANVNTAQPSLLVPATAAHENAHSLGITSEGEANFAAFLICQSSDNVNIKYSGVMLGLLYASQRLYSEDRACYNELINGLSDGVLLDLRDYSRYWDKFDGAVQDLASTVNNGYLKYNGVSDGVRSYDSLTDYLLAYYEAKSIAPAE